MKKREFETYPALAEKLRRMGIENYGRHATVFLKAFVLAPGNKIYKNNVYDAKILGENELFKQWRARMVQLRIINYHFNAENPKKSTFSPGIEIVNLINKEIALRQKLATEDFVYKEISKLKNCIKKLITKYDPPYTEEKFNKTFDLDEDDEDSEEENNVIKYEQDVDF